MRKRAERAIIASQKARHFARLGWDLREQKALAQDDK